MFENKDLEYKKLCKGPDFAQMLQMDTLIGQ